MRILLLESDAATRAVLDAALRAEGHDVAMWPAGHALGDAIVPHDAGIVLCDIEAAEVDCATLMTQCRAFDPHVTVIVTGRWGNDDMVLSAIRSGALDYLPRPLRADHVVLVVRKAVDQARLRREVQRLRDELLLALGDAHAEALTAAIRNTPSSSPVAGSLPAEEDLSVKRRTATLERTLIRRALERTGGNRTRAARLLDLSHRALLYKIREYGLQQR